MKYLIFLTKQYCMKLWQLRLRQRYSVSAGPSQQFLKFDKETSSKIILNSLMYQYNTGSAAHSFKANDVCLISEGQYCLCPNLSSSRDILDNCLMQKYCTSIADTLEKVKILVITHSKIKVG